MDIQKLNPSIPKVIASAILTEIYTRLNQAVQRLGMPNLDNYGEGSSAKTDAVATVFTIWNFKDDFLQRLDLISDLAKVFELLNGLSSPERPKVTFENWLTMESVSADLFEAVRVAGKNVLCLTTSRLGNRYADNEMMFRDMEDLARLLDAIVNFGIVRSEILGVVKASVSGLTKASLLERMLLVTETAISKNLTIPEKHSATLHGVYKEVSDDVEVLLGESFTRMEDDVFRREAYARNPYFQLHLKYRNLIKG